MADAPAGARDKRLPPFCYQTLDATAVIRGHFSGTKRATALAIYATMTEVANANGGSPGRDGFEATRAEVAELAGVSVDTFDRYVKEFSVAGLVTVERRRVGKVNLPNEWALSTPPSRTHAATPAAPVRPLARDGAEEQEEVQETSTANAALVSRDDAPATFDPTKVTLVEGRNLGFDALAEECGIDAKSPRVGEIATALNGRRNHPELGIRAMLLVELERWWLDTYAGRDSETFHATVLTEPARFEQAVARVIHEKAAKYRQRMPDGSILTPTALAKWWLDIERMEDSRGGLTVEGMLNLDA